MRLIDADTAATFAENCGATFVAKRLRDSNAFSEVVTRCKDCRSCRELNRKGRVENAYAEGVLWCMNQSNMLTITIKANVHAADAQGIKERIAMDIECYGDCKVVSIVSDRGREEQLRMKGAKL